MNYLVKFWYINSVSWVWNYYVKIISTFDSQIAVKTTWKNIGQPLFQDYTLQGKFIGFIFRILRIIFGSLLYLVIAIAGAIAYLFWLLFPLLCVISILGFFFAQPSQQPTYTSSEILP